jgi:hypothetical protein
VLPDGEEDALAALASTRHSIHMDLPEGPRQPAHRDRVREVCAMTASEYRFKVIAAWRLRCIEQDATARREYVGKHHRKPRSAAP